MKAIKYSEPRLDRLRQQLTAWRRDGNRYQRTPEPVWREAAELAQVLGISRVAQALRLNYTALKRRLAVTVVPAARRPAFVELQCPPPPAPSGECRICLQDTDGGQMTMAMASVDAVVLRELAQAFWRRSL